MDFLAQIILLIIVVAPATAVSCNSKNGMNVSCYAAVGNPVTMHFNTSSKYTTIKILKDIHMVLRIQSNKSELFPLCENRCKFSPNMVELKNLVKNDSGEYHFEAHDSNGKQIYEAMIQLNIQAPLSKPQLSQLCLPHGEMRVSCSPQGDYTELKWTLNNQTLDGNMSYLSNQRNTVILKEKVSGALSCEVRNHVSNNTSTVQIDPCPGLDIKVTLLCTLSNGTEVLVTVNAAHSWPLESVTKTFISFHGKDSVPITCKNSNYVEYLVVILSMSAALVIIVLLLAGIYCDCLATTRNHSPPVDQQPDHQEVPELLYAQVSMKKRNKSPTESQSVPEEVQYGQIKMSETNILSDNSAVSIYTAVQK